MGLRNQFLLDPNVIFLNHGSFGACPRPVFETYQRWQDELERQPVDFLGRRVADLLAEARGALGAYVGADSANLVFVPNATTAVNTVARSLELAPGDEILTTDHEYGAMDFTWQFICQRTGAQYVRHPLTLPLSSEVVDSFWAAVTPRTRVIFMSHITSPTALVLPIAPIIERARRAGILTIIDGAHAPGQLPLQLDELGADIYAGNCHKWMCAPKGAGFLYARPEHHEWIDPLVISWGWPQIGDFAGRHQWQGTRDVAAYLSVPAAIEFQANHNWPSDIIPRCHDLAVQVQQRIAALTGLAPIATTDKFRQMVAVPVLTDDVATLQKTLYEHYHIEVPGINWNEQAFLRVSFQGYNTEAEANAFIEALGELLEER